MIKFYDSVEKWQFSFFHPESLCNKRIGFVFNGCEAPLSTFKNFVQNSDLFKKNEHFSSLKIDKIRACFLDISQNFMKKLLKSVTKIFVMVLIHNRGVKTIQ